MLMRQQKLILPICLAAALSHAQSLLEVLRAKGFTEYAGIVEGIPAVTTGKDLIIYAASNDAVIKGRNSTIARRDPASGTNNPLAAFGAVRATAPTHPPSRGNETGGSDLSKRQAAAPESGSVYGTLLSDPEWVNLGPGRNQSLVEKKSSSESASQRVVYSGLGDTVTVVGSDIKFDGGVIRPVDGLLTLPSNLSFTLTSLGANRFRDSLEKVGLLQRLDKRSTITVLAPNDAAWESSKSLNDVQLAEVLKKHIIVDFVAYTPFLTDNLIYRTLGGAKVTASVRNGTTYLDDASVLAGDAMIKNGVVQVLDKVIAGGSPKPPPVPAGAATKSVPLLWQSLAVALVAITFTGLLPSQMAC